MTVIIPTYERAHMITRAVEAVLADPATTECIVSIDGSDDGSLDVARRLADRDPRVVPLFNDHLGKHGAIRAALDVADCEVMLLLDDDVVACPGLVTGHARHHAAQPHAVVMGYTPCVPPEEPKSVPYLTELYEDEYEKSCAQIEAQPSEFFLRLWGGNMSLRRDDWLPVGLRIPNFAHEDTDLGLRCARAGYVGIFDRRLRAVHHHERTARSFLAGARSFGIGRWLLFYDHSDLIGPYRSKWEDEPGSVLTRIPPLVGRSPRAAHALAVAALLLGQMGTALRARAVESLGYRFARSLEHEVGAAFVSRLDDSEIMDRSEQAMVRREGRQHRSDGPHGD